MKFIKTCYGEAVNAEFVKHIKIDCKNDANGDLAFRVLADDITLAYFPCKTPNDATAQAQARAFVSNLVDKFNGEELT